MNGCAEWNSNHTEVCVGVSFTDSFGPGGEAGGRQCVYKWNMFEPGSLDDLSDSAQLQFPTVCHMERGKLKFRHKAMRGGVVWQRERLLE